MLNKKPTAEEIKAFAGEEMASSLPLGSGACR